MTRAISMFSVIWCGPCWLIYHRGRSNRTHDDDDQKSTAKRLGLHGSLIIICQWGSNIKLYPWTQRRNDLMNSSTNNHRAYFVLHASKTQSDDISSIFRRRFYSSVFYWCGILPCMQNSPHIHSLFVGDYPINFYGPENGKNALVYSVLSMI